MEIAIFGGTFDPPTRAHEAIVRACLEREDIDEVWLMPSGQREDKPHMSTNGFRLAMLKAMMRDSFIDNQQLKLCDLEMNLPQPTHTAKTVQALKARYPSHCFWFVFGSDSYQAMGTWPGGEELQRDLGMLIVRRAGSEVRLDAPNVRELVLGGNQEEVVSSTEVREALAHGLPVSDYVTASVERFLHQHDCYSTVQ